MLDQAQAAAYAGADLSDVNSGFVRTFTDRFVTFASGVVLDLGCGAADIGIRLARALPGIAVHGIDGSGPMLAQGRLRVRAAGLESRITLEHRMLPDRSLETRRYEAVVSNSLLHHVSDPRALWRATHYAARPGAPVLVVDLRRPESASRVAEIVSQYADGADPVVQRDFTQSLHAAYTPDEVRVQLEAANLPFAVEEYGEFQLIVSGWAP